MVSVGAQPRDSDRSALTATIQGLSGTPQFDTSCVYGLEGDKLVAGRFNLVHRKVQVALLHCPSAGATDVRNWISQADLHQDRARTELSRLQGNGGIKEPGQARPAMIELEKRARLFACAFTRSNQVPYQSAVTSIQEMQQIAQYAGAADQVRRAKSWQLIVSDTENLRRRGAVFDPPHCFWQYPELSKTAAAATVAGQPPAPKPVAPAPVAATQPAAAQSEPIARRLRGTARNIPNTVWNQMRGKTWRPRMGCPSRKRLAYLEIPYVDFSGRLQTGEMIVAKDVAEDVLTVFETLAEAKFPIQRMQLAHRFDGNDTQSMNANNTSAFNCRRVTGGRRLSQHAYGRAIDINPVQNPYVRRGRTQPRAGRAYDSPAERALRNRLGVIRSNEVVTRAFASIGWKWGGNWRSLKDYQHFSRSGK